ncbi:hypothetical protein AAFF_G00105970 [Aldrovandia affinis]|uniref:Uncharacterized protein n=1 Tax=Aldrovandia affinis TaxID=143900 RepID=A0AAD7T279_9TELE|nr:hypothetical protein AAFF_G00105970 [Aldrovandia affinis]
MPPALFCQFQGICGDGVLTPHHVLALFLDRGTRRVGMAYLNLQTLKERLTIPRGSPPRPWSSLPLCSMTDGMEETAKSIPPPLPFYPPPSPSPPFRHTLAIVHADARTVGLPLPAPAKRNISCRKLATLAEGMNHPL